MSSLDEDPGSGSIPGLTVEVASEGPEVSTDDPDDDTDEAIGVPPDVSASVEPDIPPAG